MCVEIERERVMETGCVWEDEKMGRGGGEGIGGMGAGQREAEEGREQD